MDWKRDLDALIESTMAFVKDVKQRQPIPDFEDSRASTCRYIETDPAPHHHCANGLASVRARRNPTARKQFQSASGKNEAGARGLLFASEGQDAGAH
jgi:hypothetical protein